MEMFKKAIRCFERPVTRHNFLRLVDWFGPVRFGKKEGFAFLHQFELLYKTDWFHGNIGKQEAERRINLQKKDRIFLIRFSSGRSTYTMTFKRKTMYHERLNLGRTDIQSLMGWVDRESKNRNLKPCPGRYFSYLFQQSEVSGYYVPEGSVTDDF